MKNTVLAVMVAIGLCSCKNESKKQVSEVAEPTIEASKEIKKIDAHAHYRQSRDYLVTLHNQWNMQSILVDVALADSSSVRRSWEPYIAMAQKHPDLFFLCSSLIGVGIDDPDFAQKNIERLEKEIKQGARMVKVWKNFGMVTKDASGEFIQINDARLQPIWDFLAEKNIPVMAHIGEPLQAWRPLDNPNNPHYGYYTNNPQYHAYKIPEIPSYETIIAARDDWMEKNPKLKILCAHLGSMSHDVAMVAERMDKFPNMYAEPGARFGDLASQDSKKVAAFFEKYQDRLVFGSDYGTSKTEASMTAEQVENEKKSLETNYTNLWKYLGSTDSLVIRGQRTKGLGLSTQVLNKVYHQNITHFLNLE